MLWSLIKQALLLDCLIQRFGITTSGPKQPTNEIDDLLRRGERHTRQALDEMDRKYGW